MRIRPVETSGLPIPFQRRGQGPVIVGSPDPLAWANKADGAKHAWDFIANAARWNGQYIGALANTPNWTFTRASTGYAQTSGGVLQSFASGELRRTDKGVLIEGAGTNLILQSQTLDNASWTKSQITVSADAIAAPDGTTTADKIVEDSATNVHNVNQAPTTTAASHTFSVYLKAAERTFAMLYHATSNVGTVFNLSTGAVAGNADVGAPAAATITAVANGWYRCTITVTATAAANSFRIYLCSNSTTYNYAGNGSSGLYAWGAQLEATAYASSYIPTTTGSATRAADSLTVTGVTGLDYPLTLYAEFERVVDTGTFESLLYVRKSTTDLCALYIGSSDVGTVTATSSSATQGSPSVAGAIAAGTTKKLVGRIATNDMRPAVNGTLGTQDTSVTLPALAPDTLDFAHYSGGTQLNNYLRRLAIFSRALSDGELQALTT